MASRKKIKRSDELLAVSDEPLDSKFLIHQEEEEEEKEEKKEPKPTKLQTYKVETSSLLSRIQQFLPEIAAANSKLEEQLKTQPQDNFDIENVDEEQPHIEMDLGLGVFDIQEETEEVNESNFKTEQEPIKKPVIEVIDSKIVKNQNKKD